MRTTSVILLATIPVALLIFVLPRPPGQTGYRQLVGEPCQVSTLPSKEHGQIHDVQIVPGTDGVPLVRAEYSYSGDGRGGVALIEASVESPSAMSGPAMHVTAGRAVVELQLLRPFEPLRAMATRRVIVTLRSGTKLDVKSVDHTIEWPDANTYQETQSGTRKSMDQLYREAVGWIDQGTDDSLNAARQSLERILIKEPGHPSALIEMARVAMKTNWGPEGLRQAEKYLDAVLASDGVNANAKVLRGYVYVHQRRFKEAERDFSEAAAVGTNNRWLWANWGQLLRMQGNESGAIEKYQRAVSGERSRDTYDVARLDAYTNLFQLLETSKRFDEVDALYTRRSAEFFPRPCFQIEHAMWRLARGFDAASIVFQAKAAVDDGCSGSFARSVLGTAYYVVWAKQQGVDATKTLTHARVFLPEGPSMFYAVARSEATAAIIPKLVSSGTPIDVKDNQKLTALAHALSRDDVEIARRLLRFGAKPAEAVGDDAYPAALIPLMNQSVSGVKLMQASGIDYAKLRWRGMSGLEMAKRIGNAELLKVVERGAGRAI